MTEKLLTSIILRMEKEGFRITGISFDLGNMTLRNELNYQKNHYFPNPYDKSRKVYMFPDAPHLLKLVRNNLFDYGFKVPSRNCIGQCFDNDNSNMPNPTSTETTSDNTASFPIPLTIPVHETIQCKCLVPLVKKDLEEVLMKNRGGSDLRTAFNLSRTHFDVKGSQRQRVRLAAQTLSRTIAKSLLQFDPESNAYQSKHDAVLLINDWFDTMNSKRMFDQNALSCGMNPNLHGKSQLSILDQMENFLDTFHVMDTEVNGYRKKAKMPWQYGLMCSVRATRALYVDLVIKGPFTFLLTSKLNQDCLENLFSRLRALGGDNVHPTPLEAMRRMRILLLVRGADLLIRRPAVEMEDDNGDPVSDEDIAEQEQLLRAEKLTEIDIHKEQDRQEFLQSEAVSSQIVTEESHQVVSDDYIRETEESKNVFEIDLAAMEAQELEEQKQREVLQHKIDLEIEQQYTKRSQLVFANYFFHSSATDVTINALSNNINLDAVEFPRPVIITEIRLIPKDKQIHIPDGKENTLFGCTYPSKFELDIFCNDVTGNEDNVAMERLGTLSYDESQQISLNFDGNKFISSNIVVSGKYNNLAIMVYGKTEKNSNRDSQGLGYFSGFVACKENRENDKKIIRQEKKAEKSGQEIIPPVNEDKKFVPHGRKSGELSFSEKNDSFSPWIFMISNGGLTVSENDYYLDSELFEEEFNAFHGVFSRPISKAYWLYGPEEEAKRLSKQKRHFPFKEGKKIIDDFTDILVTKFGDKYDRTLLSSFSKSRLNIRVKAEKTKLSEENAERLVANKKKRLAAKAAKENKEALASTQSNGKKPVRAKKKQLGVKKKPLKGKKKKSVRELKQLAQLTNSDGRARKQLGQFLN